jgi:hypothetical protein
MAAAAGGGAAGAQAAAVAQRAAAVQAAGQTATASGVADKDAARTVQPVAAPPSTTATSPAKPAQPMGAIQLLSGANAGKELELNKPLTTLGKPGVQVAVLTRRPQGYFITHVEGSSRPAVNGQQIGAAPHALKDHDVIELAGVKMEFFIKA